MNCYDDPQDDRAMLVISFCPGISQWPIVATEGGEWPMLDLTCQSAPVGAPTCIGQLLSSTTLFARTPTALQVRKTPGAGHATASASIHR
ncbi:Uncharacterised protein [Mycolicibacterium vanbaalenii]|uniref:Uncharacterized protein n=1 Tax=Mycolicibacterium vanbaalenii TaxID=110539 RepID=A0A5S9NHE2_MYCVN|nr:Uncharacterised protein [Mycolicibacterium vanbaalenii]